MGRHATRNPVEDHRPVRRRAEPLLHRAPGPRLPLRLRRAVARSGGARAGRRGLRLRHRARRPAPAAVPADPAPARLHREAQAVHPAQRRQRQGRLGRRHHHRRARRRGAGRRGGAGLRRRRLRPAARARAPWRHRGHRLRRAGPHRAVAAARRRPLCADRGQPAAARLIDAVRTSDCR
ncbi:hypothetical protein OF001_U80152 [Pseudomonas sp. OF001]|nr:hypothetical protein OF001_U80152 [Pseudomonas sp. OF001]